MYYKSAPGQWSIKEIIIHLGDSETVVIPHETNHSRGQTFTSYDATKSLDGKAGLRQHRPCPVFATL